MSNPGLTWILVEETLSNYEVLGAEWAQGLKSVREAVSGYSQPHPLPSHGPPVHAAGSQQGCVECLTVLPASGFQLGSLIIGLGWDEGCGTGRSEARRTCGHHVRGALVGCTLGWRSQFLSPGQAVLPRHFSPSTSSSLLLPHQAWGR